MENEERVSHAGEAGHMLKLSDKHTVFSFACALALHLGNSPFACFYDANILHASTSPLNSDRGRFLRAEAAESTWLTKQILVVTV